MLRSFVPVSPESHFPIQNLPYGVFSTPEDQHPRVGVAIGEFVIDLAVLEQAGHLKTKHIFNHPNTIIPPLDTKEECMAILFKIFCGVVIPRYSFSILTTGRK